MENMENNNDVNILAHSKSIYNIVPIFGTMLAIAIDILQNTIAWCGFAMPSLSHISTGIFCFTIFVWMVIVCLDLKSSTAHISLGLLTFTPFLILAGVRVDIIAVNVFTSLSALITGEIGIKVFVLAIMAIFLLIGLIVSVLTQDNKFRIREVRGDNGYSYNSVCYANVTDDGIVWEEIDTNKFKIIKEDILEGLLGFSTLQVHTLTGNVYTFPNVFRGKQAKDKILLLGLRASQLNQ